MTVHVTIHRTCDRCGKPFDSRNQRYEEELPKYERVPIEMLKAGKQVFSFTDLCSKCEEVINKLVERICLDEKVTMRDESEKPAEAEKGASEQSGKGAKHDEHPF